MNTEATGTSQLSVLFDRQTVLDVVFRYVDRVDALDIDGVAALFAEDASVWLVGTLVDEPGVPTGFGYYQHPDGGALIELVDDALIPRFERWWRGERF